jgi:glycerol-3-phosphate dehydrogenase
LQRSEGGPEAAISRRHEVVVHGEHGGPVGLFSVAGGKLSTFRPLAEDVARALGAPARKTERDSLPSVSVAAGRLRQYGKAAAQVAAMGSRVICEHTGAIEGEVVHAVKCEQASTLSDIVMRRTGLAWTANRGLCCLEEIAGIAGRELGWDPAERARQVRQTNEDIRQHLPALDEVEG